VTKIIEFKFDDGDDAYLLNDNNGEIVKLKIHKAHFVNHTVIYSGELNGTCHEDDIFDNVLDCLYSSVDKIYFKKLNEQEDIERKYINAEVLIRKSARNLISA